MLRNNLESRDRYLETSWFQKRMTSPFEFANVSDFKRLYTLMYHIICTIT